MLYKTFYENNHVAGFRQKAQKSLKRIVCPGRTECGLVLRYYLYMDLYRICLSHKHNGPVWLEKGVREAWLISFEMLFKHS